MVTVLSLIQRFSYPPLGEIPLKRFLPPRNERGINMVDLMMWLVIAALLLAAAIQSIGYYQQAAYAYQAKSDLASAHTWAASKVAEKSSVPTANDMKEALLNGDLKLTSNNIGVIAASGGAKYCIGITSPLVTSNKTFFSSSEGISDVQRGNSLSTSCGTASNVTSGGTVTAADGSVVVDSSTPLPSISTARLRFGVSEPGGATAADLEKVARLVNEYPSIVAIYKDWTQPFNATEIQGVMDKGATPLLTWEPFVAGAGVNQPDYQLADIMAGKHDAYIDSWIAEIKKTNYPRPIMLRYAHEMNGNWYPWSQQVNGNTDWQYVNAWKHVHGRFTAAGIQDKVDWVWSPNVPYTGSTPTNVLWPGDAFVDIVGLDGFNFGTTDQYSTWKAPWEVLGGGLTQARQPAFVLHGKPIIIAETGSVQSEGANSQAKWASDLVTWLNSAQNADVIGFVWFDQIKYDELSLGQTKATNWRLDATPETAQAMKDALAARR